MKIPSLLALGFLLLPAIAQADPTAFENALYDKARYHVISKLSDEELIAYCVTKNLGGDTLLKFHDEILSGEFELAKLQSQGLGNDSPQVISVSNTLKDERIQFATRLNEVRKGLEIEAKIADETLLSLSQSQK